MTAPVERCLVIKHYATPRGKDRYVLAYLIRRPTIGYRAWRPETLYLSQTKPSDPEALSGVQGFQNRPTDEEIATFLKELVWERLVRPGEVKRGGRDDGPFRVEKYVPELTNGGICHAAWKTVFAREPPTKLFFEFARPSSDAKRP